MKTVYNGYDIEVAAFPMGRGFFWRYEIDGTLRREQDGDNPSATEELALREGLRFAQLAIDKLPPK